jgi:TATA-box binding protein (TBP) (component of TFIID and TFIIIB)
MIELFVCVCYVKRMLYVFFVVVVVVRSSVIPPVWVLMKKGEKRKQAVAVVVGNEVEREEKKQTKKIKTLPPRRRQSLSSGPKKQTKQISTISSSQFRFERIVPPSLVLVPSEVKAIEKVVRLRKLKPAYEMRLINHVTRAHIIQIGRNGTSKIPEFNFPVMVDVLKGFHSGNGFACVTLRQRNPKVCCHIYDTGCIIACGSPVENDQLLGMYKVLWRLQDVFGWHLRLKPNSYSVSNVVTSMALGYHLDVMKFYSDHSDRCQFEPDNFPGLSFKPNGADNKRPLVIVHASGALVVVSAFTLEHACRTIAAVDWIRYKISQQ